MYGMASIEAEAIAGIAYRAATPISRATSTMLWSKKLEMSKNEMKSICISRLCLLEQLPTFNMLILAKILLMAIARLNPCSCLRNSAASLEKWRSNVDQLYLKHADRLREGYGGYLVIQVNQKSTGTEKKARVHGQQQSIVEWCNWESTYVNSENW